MISQRRLLQSVVAALVMTGFYLGVAEGSWPPALIVCVLGGFLFFAIDPFGPERGGFGGMGDDEHHLGG